MKATGTEPPLFDLLPCDSKSNSGGRKRVPGFQSEHAELMPSGFLLFPHRLNMKGKRKKMELKVTSGGQFGNNDFKIKNFTPKHATFAIRRTECSLGPYLFIHSCKFVLQLLAPRFIPRCLLQFYLQHKKIKPRQEFQRRLAKC